MTGATVTLIKQPYDFTECGLGRGVRLSAGAEFPSVWVDVSGEVEIDLVIRANAGSVRAWLRAVADALDEILPAS